MVWRVCAHTSVGSSRSFALSITDQLFRGLSTQHWALGRGRGAVAGGDQGAARAGPGVSLWGDGDISLVCTTT